ncbi:MAG: nucleotidyltransferase domain-containing protein [Methyloprofundus sp.]|nr:nucleotidyltransferase domain-containing protein [Methyloprofundus sp.]
MVSRLLEDRIALRKERISELESSLAILIPKAVDAEVYLFGSLARGDFNSFSDIDLCFSCNNRSDKDFFLKLIKSIRSDKVFVEKGLLESSNQPLLKNIRRDRIKVWPLFD